MKAVIAVPLVLCLIGAGGYAQEDVERRNLLEQRERLTDRLEELRRERDFLLFQKEFYASDSKYLLFDFSTGRCQLKYRNRILKDAPFSVSPNIPAKARSIGVVTLTRKREMPGKKTALVFGESFIVQSERKKKPLPAERRLPRVLLSQRDMKSMFYALEEGAKAYIVQ